MAQSLESTLMAAKRSAKRGDYAEAERLYQGVLLQFPANVRARKGLDEVRQTQNESLLFDGISPQDTDRLVALINAGRFAEAVEAGEALAIQHPQSIFVQDALGQAYYAMGQADRAVACFRTALAVQPERAEAHFNLAVVLQNMGQDEAAAESYRVAIQYKPDYLAAYNNLGALLHAMGDHRGAVANLSNAIKLKPDYIDAYNNLANAWRELGNSEKAAAYYEHALALEPAYAKAHYNLGMLRSEQGKKGEALLHFERAIAQDPAYADAHREIGGLLLAFGLRDEAIMAVDRALAADPADAISLGMKLHQQGHICDWDGIASEMHKVPMLGVADKAVAPWGVLALEDSPERHKQRSMLRIELNIKKAERFSFSPPPSRAAKLRIGYFSSDFSNHAVMHLICRIFELHDRSRFEVHGYSCGDKDSSDYVHLFDHFHDVQNMQDDRIAAFAREAGLDIAIDLNGHTKGGRLGIFAHGVAPVQISYLGYPGTTGAPFIDYTIADRVVIPDEQRAHYSESVIYLPDSYQPNDNRREIADLQYTRADMGLPVTSFVFACFNSTYKITPEEFDIWMRLLMKVEGSVLWLYKGNHWAEANLRKEAEKRGVESNRIIFAENMPVEQHLARQHLADLFLDTFNVNAHTTASDALWGGLPVLTRMGKGFAARVAGSLLHAVGLPDMVTQSSEEYEARALELATDPAKMAEVKARLAANRLTTPLFDTERFVRHIEAGYEQAYDRFFNGREPADIAVEG